MDLINVMTYDLRGSWEGFTGEDSPLFAGPEDQGGYVDFNVVSELTETWEHDFPFTFKQSSLCPVANVKMA